MGSKLLAIEKTNQKVFTEVNIEENNATLVIDEKLDSDIETEIIPVVRQKTKRSSDTSENEEFFEEKKVIKRKKKMAVKWTEQEIQIVKRY